jgi:AAA+ ATPase superfamily predicted ATPase
MAVLNEFVDREQEMVLLEAEFAEKRASLVIVYGRRRLGKTRLLREFIKNKDALYFLAEETPETENQAGFGQMVEHWTGLRIKYDPLNTSYTRWQDIFNVVLDYKPEVKKIIVIDEYQYLGMSNRGIPSVFQKIWDLTLSQSNIMLVLCGSLITMMKSQTLLYSAPLYGRQTASIRMKQIPFRYYEKFLNNAKITRNELIKRYALTGGVPYYIDLFKTQKTMKEAVRNFLLSPNGRLYDEPAIILRREVDAVAFYFLILKIIAEGNCKLSAIAGRLGKRQSDITSYLATLIDLDILARETPITEEHPEKSHMGLYKIKDNFINFWFKYIFPNRSFIEGGSSEWVEEKINESFIDGCAAYVYEDICRESLSQKALLPWNIHFSRVGRWWDKNTEIDIVALDDEGENALFCECKFRNRPTGLDVLTSLEEKARQVPWNKNTRHNYYALFSANGYNVALRKLATQRKDLALLQ